MPTMFDVENLRKRGVKKIQYSRVTYLQPLLIQDILVLKLLTHKYSCICTNNCHGDTKYCEAITVGQVIQTSDIDISFKSPCPMLCLLCNDYFYTIINSRTMHKNQSFCMISSQIGNLINRDFPIK